MLLKDKILNNQASSYVKEHIIIIDDICSSFSNPPSEITFPSTSSSSSSPSLPSFNPVFQSSSNPGNFRLPKHLPPWPIPSHILQCIAPDLLPFLTHLINTSLSTGCFPNSLKEERVNRLLKKPTLNLSFFFPFFPLSKARECTIFNQLSSYLHQNNLFDPHSSGFKAGHSTETALFAVSELLPTARAASLSSVVILLDLSAAFDTVNHQILISSLQDLGVSGSALSLLLSYLKEHTDRVTWRGSVSEPFPLTTGVPQGFVLGPLLFSLYTNSRLCHSLTWLSYQSLSYQSETQVAAWISACLTDISQWMSAHQI